MHRKTLADTSTHRNVTVQPPRLYNSQEARELLGGISVRQFRRLTSSGALRALKQGAFVYIPKDALDEYIASLPTLAANEHDDTPAGAS